MVKNTKRYNPNSFINKVKAALFNKKIKLDISIDTVLNLLEDDTCYLQYVNAVVYRDDFEWFKVVDNKGCVAWVPQKDMRFFLEQRPDFTIRYRLGE